jgi:plasmid stabilization system protein ParE
MVSSQQERLVNDYSLTAGALRDLRDIWEYIDADGGADVADRIARQFDAAFAQLAESPALGHPRRDARNQRYRFWTVGRFVIAYFPDTVPLQIVRIVGGRRDFRRLF